MYHPTTGIGDRRNGFVEAVRAQTGVRQIERRICQCTVCLDVHFKRQHGTAYGKASKAAAPRDPMNHAQDAPQHALRETPHHYRHSSACVGEG